MRHIIYLTLCLAIGIIIPACGGSNQNEASDGVDSTELTIDSAAIEAPQVMVDTTTPPPQPTKGMVAAEEKEEKDTTIPPCSEAKKEEMANWKSEIATYKERLAMIDDPDVQAGIKQAMAEAQKEIDRLKKLYNCE